MLYVTATPIGNLEDISLRALRVLREADIIACEDTRQTAKLAAEFGLRAHLVSYHQHSSRSRLELLLSELKRGKNIAVVSDGGTPGISDPGLVLIKGALKENIKITHLPGPTACISALVLSGLPTDGFVFLGFLPRKKGKIKKLLQNAVKLGKTVIFYESPYRLKGSLECLRDLLGGDIQAAVAREITKKFEEIIRGSLKEVEDAISSKKIMGEITVVFSPDCDKSRERENEDIAFKEALI